MRSRTRFMRDCAAGLLALVVTGAASAEAFSVYILTGQSNSLGTTALVGGNPAGYNHGDSGVSAHLGELVAGTNVLAIHALNEVGSSDMLMIPELVAVSGGVAQPIEAGFLDSPTPGQPNGQSFQGFVGDTAFSIVRLGRRGRPGQQRQCWRRRPGHRRRQLRQRHAAACPDEQRHRPARRPGRTT